MCVNSEPHTYGPEPVTFITCAHNDIEMSRANKVKPGRGGGTWQIIRSALRGPPRYNLRSCGPGGEQPSHPNLREIGPKIHKSRSGKRNFSAPPNSPPPCPKPAGGVTRAGRAAHMRVRFWRWLRGLGQHGRPCNAHLRRLPASIFFLKKKNIFNHFTKKKHGLYFFFQK